MTDGSARRAWLPHASEGGIYEGVIIRHALTRSETELKITGLRLGQDRLNQPGCAESPVASGQPLKSVLNEAQVVLSAWKQR